MAAVTPVQELLQHLLESAIVPRETWDGLPAWARERASSAPDRKRLVDHLLAQGLLTGYQALRIGAGKLDGLILGSYRVLDRLGAGNTGVIFKAEHVQTRQAAAVKVLVPPRGDDSQALLRFEAERQAVAQLRHPHIVSALDLGEISTDDPNSPVLYYYAMEYIQGQDLERLVKERGPLTEEQALVVAEQIASALGEAHRHQFVHRDVNPSNIVVTPDGHAKLLDFGLVRHPGFRSCEPGTSLGMFEFAAPEQLKDAACADIRADIFGLGATLFWSLTGRPPFPRSLDLQQDLTRRATEPPPSARAVREELSEDMERLLQNMLATDAVERFSSPDAVITAVRALRKTDGPIAEAPLAPASAPSRASGENGVARRALVVTESMQLARFCRDGLVAESVDCEEAHGAEDALETARAHAPEVVLLDADLDDGRALEVLQALRQNPPCPHLKVLMLTPSAAPEIVSDLLAAGADGYVAMPLDMQQLRTRVRTALHLRDAQDQADTERTHDTAPALAGAAIAESGESDRLTDSWLNPVRWIFRRRKG